MCHDSDAAIEQLMVGYRDGLLPLDESGDGDAKVSLQRRARALDFAIGRNRARNLDKSFEKRSNLAARDCRNIILSTSERALGAIAEDEGVSRLGGEEVRLIDVPRLGAWLTRIFDEAPWSGSMEYRLKLGQKTADKLRLDAVRNQDHALHKFLLRYVSDSQAVETLKRYKGAFESSVETFKLQSSDRRSAASFAAIYAAAALAVDYKILPWGKKKTRKAIRSACWPRWARDTERQSQRKRPRRRSWLGI